MSWKRQPSPLNAFLRDDEEWKAKSRATRVWVSSLGIDDGVVREAIMAVRATNLEELKHEIQSGYLLRQRGMGTARMHRAREIAQCVFPAPPAHIKNGIVTMFVAMSKATRSEPLAHDIDSLIRCLVRFNNVTDVKLYDKEAMVFARSAQTILGG